MKIKMEILKSVFDDHLRDFELADAIYMAAEREFIDFDLDHGTSEEMKAVREKLHSACADREFYAVVLCKYLLSCKDLICFEADPVDALEDSPAADLVDAPEDIFPVMSAKCKLRYSYPYPLERKRHWGYTGAGSAILRNCHRRPPRQPRPHTWSPGKSAPRWTCWIPGDSKRKQVARYPDRCRTSHAYRNRPQAPSPLQTNR